MTPCGRRGGRPRSLPLLGVASGGACQAGASPRRRWSLTPPFQLNPCGPFLFCGAFRHVGLATNAPRRYRAPCPLKPGLSSPAHHSGGRPAHRHDSIVSPTPLPKHRNARSNTCSGHQSVTKMNSPFRPSPFHQIRYSMLPLLDWKRVESPCRLLFRMHPSSG